MSISDNSESPPGGGQMICPKCRATISKAAYLTHVASQCPEREGAAIDREVSRERTGLLAEYDDEQRRASTIERTLEIHHIGSEPGPRQISDKWTVCGRCAERVKVDYLAKHTCSTGRQYVREAYKLGTNGAGLVSTIEALMGDGHWYLASGIARSLSRKYSRPVGLDIVNSVLYSFAGRRFIMHASGSPMWQLRHRNNE